MPCLSADDKPCGLENQGRPAEIFAREVLSFLVGRELLSPEWAERLLSRRHTGFSVHSLVRTQTKPEAEWMGKYMIKTPAAVDTLFPALL